VYVNLLAESIEVVEVVASVGPRPQRVLDEVASVWIRFKDFNHLVEFFLQIVVLETGKEIFELSTRGHFSPMFPLNQDLKWIKNVLVIMR
jgi:hypothetical protein